MMERTTRATFHQSRAYRYLLNMIPPAPVSPANALNDQSDVNEDFT